MTGCRHGDCDHSRSRAAMRMCASPFVTEAGWWFGEIAKCFGEWQRRFGHANIGLAQRLLVCPRRSEPARKSLRQRGSRSDGQPVFAGDGRLFSIVTKPGCRNGAASWAESSGVPFGCAGGVWGKPVFRLTGLSGGGKSGAGAGANSARRNGHTSGMETRLTRNGGGRVWSRR